MLCIIVMQCEPGDRFCEESRRVFRGVYNARSLDDVFNTVVSNIPDVVETLLPEEVKNVVDTTKAGYEPVKDVAGKVYDEVTRKRTPKDVDDGLKNAIGVSQRSLNPLKPTIDDVPDAVMRKAKMVAASHKIYKGDVNSAQDYLDDNNIKASIDPELSTNEVAVLIDDEGLVRVTIRGTDPKNIDDLLTDGALLAGAGDELPKMGRVRKVMDNAYAKYGQVEEVLGYSLGSNQAIRMGQIYDVPVTAFNPYLTKNVLAGESTAPVHIYRTTEDFASFGGGFVKKNNWTIDSVLPHKDSLMPFEAHKLSNFTKTSERRAGNTETIMKATQEQANKWAEMATMDSIRTAQEQGKTFTEWVHEDLNNNTGSDTVLTEDGPVLSGGRMRRDSTHATMWEEAQTASGTSAPPFTKSEESHFNMQPEVEPSETTMGSQQRKTFMEKPPAERQAVMENELGKVNDVVARANTATSAHSEVMRAMNPVNLGVGVAAGMGSHAVMDKIDPDYKMNFHARNISEGLLTGVFTDAISGLMTTAEVPGGSAALPMAVGYEVGANVSKGVNDDMNKRGRDPYDSSLISNVLGGIAGGMAAGAMAGLTAAPETGGLSIPIGGIAGAVSGFVNAIWHGDPLNEEERKAFDEKKRWNSLSREEQEAEIKEREKQRLIEEEKERERKRIEEEKRWNSLSREEKEEEIKKAEQGVNSPERWREIERLKWNMKTDAEKEEFHKAVLQQDVINHDMYAKEERAYHIQLAETDRFHRGEWLKQHSNFIVHNASVDAQIADFERRKQRDNMNDSDIHLHRHIDMIDEGYEYRKSLWEDEVKKYEGEYQSTYSQPVLTSRQIEAEKGILHEGKWLLRHFEDIVYNDEVGQHIQEFQDRANMGHYAMDDIHLHDYIKGLDDGPNFNYEIRKQMWDDEEAIYEQKYQKKSAVTVNNDGTGRTGNATKTGPVASTETH